MPIHYLPLLIKVVVVDGVAVVVEVVVVLVAVCVEVAGRSTEIYKNVTIWLITILSFLTDYFNIICILHSVCGDECVCQCV